MAPNAAANQDTMITVKVAMDGNNRRFKMPLRDLGANVLPEKLRFLLAIPPGQDVVFERYSDSAGSFVTLDSNNPSVYKQLYRAAKAKSKLRIKVTLVDRGMPKEVALPTTSGIHIVGPSAESTLTPSGPDTGYYNGMSHAHSAPFKATIAAEFARPTASDAVEPTATASQDTCSFSSERHCIPSTHCDADEKHSADVSSTALPGSYPEISKHETFLCAPVRDAFPSWLDGRISLDTSPRQEAPEFHDKCSIMYTLPGASYSILCNGCTDAIRTAHYHCSICENGDFDLCQKCINNGQTCGGEGHWLIKRMFKEGGELIQSTTETIAPRKKSATAPEIKEEAKLVTKAEDEFEETTLTCNACVTVFPATKCVICTSCDDYHLCVPCHIESKHGHHPGHAFKAIAGDDSLSAFAESLCAPGRNKYHHAICDGCDKPIHGVRHKCLNCPDWDYCTTCIEHASFFHPGHRFAPIYERIAPVDSRQQKHFGVFCDGPLCGAKTLTYIVGDRYKCAVCHDTDFCANCEANPANRHNRTHPLIKFKSPVRNVTVSTMGEKEDGGEMPTMGDIHARTRSMATETNPPASSTNAATQVQTVADFKPSGDRDVDQSKDSDSDSSVIGDLRAEFVRDTVTDGTTLPPNYVFVQTWTLRNPGPGTWPSGCTVNFVGGDNMRNIDPAHPSSVTDLQKSVESVALIDELAPGKSWTFKVTLRTPSRAGKFISYWRLTTPDGTKFGHKLWCDISVDVNRISPSPEVLSSQMLIKHGINPKKLSATQLHNFQQQSETVQLKSIEVYATNVAQHQSRHSLSSSSPNAHDSPMSPRTPELQQISPQSSQAGQCGKHALRDYESQLKQLEQQNRKRLAFALQLQEKINEGKLNGLQSTFEAEEGGSSTEPSFLEEQGHLKSAREDDKVTESQPKTEGSAMIFPTLDKESPMASVHDAAEVSKHAEEDDADLLSDVASLTLQDEETDDGFLTDEEYDILDASDEEFLAEAAKEAQK
ncbi:MAG: hypothetical protein M1833_005140 [Piccolia ochrophora]|nr:MAG: hypothetical protein M1833_005140 [Piccolia ochrophora]